MKTSQQAFEAGWLHGRRHKRHQSIREVMASHTRLTLELAEVYLNGQNDGIRGDRFRLNPMPQESERAVVAGERAARLLALDLV